MCDAVALANQLEQLLQSRQADEAGRLFLTQTSVLKVPGLIGSNTFEGPAKIVAKWKKDQEDGLKFLKKAPWAAAGPGVAKRKASVSILVMTAEVEETMTFTPTGKLDKMAVKKL
eukprot:TRINITY_DN851_c0_g2_i1.p1 TRINITY_DN851_c0_g2~~TRINITY_DN851_c0_g2_i1.p1  ORF type:complete len:115 (+),score=70.96 TRINITY_DN851_c0_g2_i1:87-431(+)